MRNITLEKIVRLGMGVLGLALVVSILYNYSTLFGYLIVSLILSYILDPIINRLQRMGVKRTIAIVFTLSSVILFLVFVSTSVIPIIANQMVELVNKLNIENIKKIANQIEEELTSRLEFLPKGYLGESVSQIGSELFDMNKLSNALGGVVDVFSSIFSAVLVIPFASFFFLKDGSRIRRDLLRLIPNKYFETTLTLLDKIEKRLGFYFRSVLLQSFLVAFTSWLLLTIVGLDNSLSVGIAVGVANTIPYFGPIIGYILSSVVSIVETGDFSLVLFCVIAIAIVQILDNLLFQPFLFSRSADMHPVAILFIILIGAETAGILGMLIAIPIATIVKITINQVNWSFNNYQVFRRNPNLPSNSSR